MEGTVYEQDQNAARIKKLRDRGRAGTVAESFGCELDLPTATARGDDVCQIRFVRRKKED